MKFGDSENGEIKLHKQPELNERATRVIKGTPVYGVGVDEETRCAHYHLDVDIIAIKFPCCNRYYPCHACHEAVAGHQARRWASTDFHTEAILCGHCGAELTINEYLGCNSVCPRCGAKFNQGCKNHAHLYFDVQA